jgi:hypothetical protein
MANGARHRGGRWRRIRAAIACTVGTVALLGASEGRAAPVAVRYSEASSHGFVVLSDLAGKALARGELVQWQERGALANRLVFHFDDGSLYDETVRFSAAKSFRLLAYHLVQKGPAFRGDSETQFDRSGRYTARKRSMGGDEERDAGTVELPEDVYNGMTSTLLRNLAAGTNATVHLLAFTPKPNVLDLALAPEGADAFWVGGARHTATRFLVTPKVTGAKGVVASVIGKQPEPIRFWLTEGRVPTFVKFEGPLYVDGPAWRIELASLRWKR